MAKRIVLIKVEKGRDDDRLIRILRSTVTHAAERMVATASRDIACPGIYDDTTLVILIERVAPAIVIIQGEDPGLVVKTLAIVKDRQPAVAVIMLTRDLRAMEDQLASQLADESNWLIILELGDVDALINKLLQILVSTDGD